MLALSAAGGGGGGIASIFDRDLWTAEDLSAVGDGNPVTTWAGTNGNYIYTGGGGAANPTYNSSAQASGYPGVTFDGGDWMDAGSGLAALYNDGAPFGMMIVVRGSATSGSFRSVWARGNGSATAQYMHLRWPNSSSYNVTSTDNTGAPFINYSFDTGSVVANGWLVINYGGDGDVLNVWENGTQIVTDRAITALGSAQTFNRAGIGALLRSSVISHWTGSIHAVGEKSSIITAGEITQIGTWVTDTWGL